MEQHELNFNSRAHVERDSRSSFFFFRASADFNSRAHVERDPPVTARQKCPSKISTHALTWSATDFAAKGALFGKISTHALTWSATLCGETSPAV